MTLEIFKTHNADGSPKTCKFCHAEVWWDQFEERWYNPGGEQLHSATCPLAQAHAKEQGARVQQTRRDQRREP